MVSSTLYATADEVFDSINQTSKSDTGQVNRILRTVSRWIDGYMNRGEYGFVAESTASARVYAGEAKAYLYVMDFVELSTVKMKTSIDQTTYDYTFTSGEIIPFRGDPRRPNYNKLPYHGILVAYNATYPFFTSGRPASVSRKWNRLHPDTNNNITSLPTVEVTAKYGYAVSVPDVIKEVTIMETIRLYKQERAGMGDAGMNVEIGQTQFVKALHPAAKAILDSTNLRMPKIIGLRR